MKRSFFLKNILFLVVFSFLSVNLIAADPEWYGNQEKVYPAKEYLCAVGSGSSESIAKDSALASIVKIFNAKVKSYNTAVKDYKYSEENNKSEFLKTERMTQKIQVTSEAEFFCVEFTDSFYSKKEKKYVALAYINRADASAVYSSKINPLLREIQNVQNKGTKEKEPLYDVLNLQYAKSLCNIVKPLIDNAIIINPSEKSKYKNGLDLIADVRSSFEDEKRKTSFSISINRSDCDSIVAGLSSALEDSGFVYTKVNPIYSIDIQLTFDEEMYEAGFFVRPSILISVYNTNNETVESYSQAYPRFTHSSEELAYSRAIFKVKEDLEENFLIEYRGTN